MPSSCSAEVLRAYFNNGTIPPAGVVCETDFEPFSDDQVLSSLGTSASLGSDLKTLSELLAEFRTNVSIPNVFCRYVVNRTILNMSDPLQ